MDQSDFEDGYLGGWSTVAGNRPPPPSPTCPPEDQRGDKTAFQVGFEYGRADAHEQFQPSRV